MELIYLLENDETTGPFSKDDVRGAVNDGDITNDTYAFCEGMPDWRSSAEALVWADARKLRLKRADISKQVAAVFSGKLNQASARLKVVEGFRKQGVWPTDEERESINTVIELNVAVRQGLESAKQGMTPGSLDAFPAEEIFALATQRFVRDWPAAWVKASGRLFGSRMIARKDDPVWHKLGDFGLAVPPFSVDMGFWTRDVSREDAIVLGVVMFDNKVSPRELPVSTPWILVES